jgi:hypothetical protein
MGVLLDDAPRLAIREPVPWQIVRDGDELQWAVSIYVPFTSAARCEAIISVGVTPVRLGSDDAQ